MSTAPARPLRVVHITDCYLPRIGGIELQVAELAGMQARAGHETHVITTTAARHDSRGSGAPAARVQECHFPAAGVQEPRQRTASRAASGQPQVHRVAVPLTVRALRYEIPLHRRADRDLAALLTRLRPDVVHVHVGVVAPFSWAGARCAARRGVPLVASVHSTWGPGARILYRGLAAGCRWTRWPIRVLPVSNTVAGQVRRVTRDRVPVAVVPNGIATHCWRAPARRDDPGSGRPLHVVAVGRLAPRKRMLPLLRVLRAASVRLGDGAALRVSIAGAGPMAASMRRYLARYRMAGWVSMLGELDRHEVHGLLADADVFIATAVHEAFGLAALEARTVGVPILARRDSGIAELVEHRRNGLLASDDLELVSGLVRLAEHADVRQRLQVGDPAGAALAYDWSTVLAQLDGCYARADAACRSGRAASIMGRSPAVHPGLG